MRFGLRSTNFVAGLSHPVASGTPPLEPSSVYDFDGNTYNRFTGGQATTTPTEYTLAAWVRPAQVGSTRTLFVRSNGAPVSSYSHALYQFTNAWRAYTFDGGVPAIVSLTAPVLNVWHHVAVTAKNSNFMRLYVNGAEEGSIGIGTLWTGGNDWWIAVNDGLGSRYSGYMCDAAIWLKQLTPAEVASLATGTRGVPLTVQASSLVLFCPMTDAPDGVTLVGDWLDSGGGGVSQTRAGAPIGRISTPSPPPPQNVDDFESYAISADLNGLNGGAGTLWAGAYVSINSYFGLIAYDSFEAYSPGANIDGLNAGSGEASSGSWAGAFVSRT